MAIAEAFLGALFTILLERLASRELLKFLRPLGINDQLKKWRKKLLIIESLLVDAENKQTSNRAVREWLNELEQFAYDLEDLVDKLSTEAQQRTLMKTEETSTSKVQKFLSTIISTNFSIRDFISDSRMDSKLKEMNDRLEDLVEQVSVLNLVGRSEKTGQRLQLTSVVEKSEVHGREKEKEDILNKVLGVESTSPPKISVIPIVGMGGVGKTTLVQLVYSDDRLKGDYFDLKAWACVSDEFDAFRLTKIIFEAVSSVKYDSDDFNKLQEKLKETLSGKRFLVVLDDVWNDDYVEWDNLLKPFLAGKPGSKIIVTTRHEKVAKVMSDNEPYHLDVLSEGAALTLLAQHSLRAKTFDERPDLREIGKSVVWKCKNLPLAVKAIGGLLRTTDNRKDWEDVVKSDTWMAEDKGGILPALKLSYQYLPSELKRCFAYCALFPKDYEFDKSKLEILWKAEGFVQDSQEYLGSRNFDKLLSRSFFQQSSANSSRFVMHDLHNDLAMFVAGDKCLRTEYDAAKGSLPGKISEKVRHLSIIRHRREYYYKFNFVNQARGLRTFLSLSSQKDSFHHVNLSSQRILLDLLPNLDHIRVLSLAYYSIYELPNSVGELKQLRYLDLTYTELERLPESLNTLINLKVLILKGCLKLTKLPANMENLFNLCHLDIAGTRALHEMPQGIGELTSLHTLSRVIVSESGGMRLKSLGNLSHLQGEISIEELQNVVNVPEAKDARLIDKQNLDKISLRWRAKPSDSQDDEILHMDVLNALKPHENLSSLDINCYGGASFSNWIGDPTFSKLASISFYGCRKCTDLPPLGQLPFLRELHIRGMNQVKLIGDGFYGNRDHGEIPFPSLETLRFAMMPDWEEWLGLGNEAKGVIKLPRLRILFIERCPKLVRLPILSLPSLRELCASECDKVVLNRMLDLESLTKLNLMKISGLTSVYEAFVQFPFALENFDVRGCTDLKTLWTSGIGQSLVNLRRVLVHHCPRLLQKIDVLPVLRRLDLWDCGALEFSPNSISCIEQLSIDKCPSLKMSTALHDSSTTLESLRIGRLVKLNLTNLLGSVQSYSSLTSINLYQFDGLELFGLPTPNLRSLEIRNCPNLESLPHRMDLLLSLQLLIVELCPSLIEPFPQGNVPPNLTLLLISKCGNLNSLGEWELHKLTSLQYFSFSPSDVNDNDDDDQHYVLPPSVTRLGLSDLLNLKTLPKGFQNLTSLRYLVIKNCPKLVALPMEDQLDKLSSLLIDGCPLLKQRCLKNKGDYWPIIANIPEVAIDFCNIHDDRSHQVEGPKSPDELLTSLQRVLEESAPVLVSSRLEAEERRNNVRLREEQDAAYRAALEADQARERQRKLEQERLEHEAAEAERKRKEEEEALERAAREAAEKQAAIAKMHEEKAASLGAEPEKGPDVTQVKI